MIIIYMTSEEKKSKNNEEISTELNIYDFVITNAREVEENDIMEKLYNLQDCGAETKESKSSGSSNHSVNKNRKSILENNENRNTSNNFNLSI